MTQTYSSDARYTERLQISLSPSLKKLAKKLGKLKKMNLSELFRYLLLVEAGEVKRVETDYNKVLEKAMGCIDNKKHQEWAGDKSISQWLKKTRQSFDRSF